MQRFFSDEMQSYEVEHAGKVRERAAECTLFLKRNGDFPVQPCRVNLYGSGARRTIKGGKGSGDVNTRYNVSIEEGLKNAGFEVVTTAWMDEYDRVVKAWSGNYYNALKKEAEAMGTFVEALLMFRPKPPIDYDIPLTGDGELNLYVVARDSTEGMDRQAIEGDYYLLKNEVRDILELARRKEKFMLVLNVGGAIDLSPVADEVENILLLSQLGQETGNVFADILTGKSVPSGKLSATWANKLHDHPSAQWFGTQTEVDYREGLFVGYRYFDTFGVPVRYPFGFGLGYTDFSVQPVSFEVCGNEIRIRVTVKNTGNFRGREVVQVYCSCDAEDDAPRRKLVAFAKTGMLAPGVCEAVELVVSAEDMAAYSAGKSVVLLAKGLYFFDIGNSIQSTVCACAVRMTEDVILQKVHPLRSHDVETLHAPARSDHASPALGEKPFSPRFQPKDRKAYAVSDAVRAMPTEKLVSLCIGVFNDMTLRNNIGNSGKKVAGSAGETYSEEGIPPLVLADGPAGLRLSKCYRLTEEGGVVALDNPMAGILPDTPSETPHGKDVCYQYCTAIPVGTALAQSWDVSLCEEMGDLVGKEMQLFGVDVWLAPAFNIQRNPLCGRNFEYYSEDPYLSGTVAAAVTEGVQKNEGCSVTIKHFCCNNQETDRAFSSSNMSERTLRELYLKGFEICIRKAQPKALMTSYNLLNGIHTANDEGVLMRVLREEWGYDGLVMTDWLSTGGMGTGAKYGPASPSGCIRAQNDLIMPGREQDREDILRALGCGELTRGQLEVCADRVYRLASKKGGNA